MGKALRISLSKSCCILKAIKTAACGASGLQAAVFLHCYMGKRLYIFDRLHDLRVDLLI